MTEQFYDDVIAPQLAALAKLCAEQDASFVAGVEFDGILAETTLLTDDATPAMTLVRLAIAVRGNLDRLLFAAVKQLDVSRSMFLSRYAAAPTSDPE